MKPTKPQLQAIDALIQTLGCMKANDIKSASHSHHLELELEKIELDSDSLEEVMDKFDQLQYALISINS